MEIKSFYCLVLIVLCVFGKSQVSLTVKELSLNNYKSYIPNNKESLDGEIYYPGHLLEISLLNESDKSISFPIDTVSYALPFTENLREYYNMVDNIPRKPDVRNMLSVFAFVYQNGDFKISDLGTVPFYEEMQWREIDRIEKLRLSKIYQWMTDKNISDELSGTYNWYLMKNMITIPAHKNIKYRIYFNPALKKLDKYSDTEYYFGWDPKIRSEVIFKLILPKNLYKFLTKEDRRKYPNLFTGIVSSNRIFFKGSK